MEETKIIYHIDDEDTPYLIKLSIPADKVTLGDFKNALNRPNYKFFFKSMDDDFGVVKEEIIDESAHLPCFNGRVVSWLVAAESSASDTQSQCDSQQGDPTPPPNLPGERVGGIGDSRPPSFHANASSVHSQDNEPCDTCTETDSVISSRRVTRVTNGHNKHERHRGGGHGYETSSSVITSDIETTSFFDSEDDASSRFSSMTDATSRSSKYGRHRRRKRKHRMPPISRASSFSSITDSTMSLNIITVTLNMDTVNFLGISIVGQSNKSGDGGIYVGSIMKGGAVAQDGRIEPGDMILEVNGISFENMSNDDAVRVLREAVQKPGPVTLVVAKCWDPNPKGYFTIPRHEPVRPIDPSAWVAHTTAMVGNYGGPGSTNMSSMTSGSSSITSSIPDSEYFDRLTVTTDMASVVRAMAQPDSGLEVRDRSWLKITIPNAFIGSDLVDWLHQHIEGFADRRDARKYACNLLKAGFIRHTVNKITFSEQCYYIFGDLSGNMSLLSLDDVDSVSEVDRDTLAPLPPPAWGANVPYGFMPPQNTVLYPTAPPMSYTNDMGSFGPGSYIGGSQSYIGGGGNGSAGSVNSGSVAVNTCTCIISHTCVQLRKLWEKEKERKSPQCTATTTTTTTSTSSEKERDAPQCIASTSSSGNVENKDSEKCPLANQVGEVENKDCEKISGKGQDSMGPDCDKLGSSASGGSDRRKDSKDKKSASGSNSGSETETGSMASVRRGAPSERSLPPPPAELMNMPPDVSNSRQSFRMAMGNPSTPPDE